MDSTFGPHTIFSQALSSSKNAFVFPPFTLIGPLLKFLTLQPCPFTLIAPDVSPRKYWWPLLQRQATVAFKLGQKGDNSILLFPAKTGHSPWESRPLQWDFGYFALLLLYSFTKPRTLVMYKLKEVFFSIFFSCFRPIRYCALYQFLFKPAFFFRTFPWWRESGFPQSVAQTVPTLTALLLHFANNAVTHAERRPAFQILRKFFWTLLPLTTVSKLFVRLRAVNPTKNRSPAFSTNSSVFFAL